MEELLALQQMKEEYRPEQGNCVVVSGSDPVFGAVACKVIALHAEDAHVLQTREMQILENLQHPNICPVLKTERKSLKGNFYFIITMPLAHTTLSKEKFRRSELGAFWDETELWSILQQVVSALAYAQQQQVCHRDIKPNNLLLEPSGRVLVADFGSGKLATLKGIAPHTWVGTLPFPSPELQRAMGEILLGTASAAQYCPYRSDVYSLGVTMLHLMLLVMPQCQAKAGSEQLTAEMEGWLQDLRPHYSEELLVVVGSMLEFDSQLRPDFIQLEASLQALQGPPDFLPSTLLACSNCRKSEVLLKKLPCGHFYCVACLLSFANN